MLWGLAFAAGALIGSVVLLSLAGSLFDVIGVVLRAPFKGVFILGVLALVFSQVSVSSFLTRNGLMKACDVGSLEQIARVSDFVLMIFAIASIFCIANYVTHTLWALAYILVTIVMDVLVWKGAKRASKSYKEKKKPTHHSSLCERICHTMLRRLDGSSFVIVLLLLLIAVLISAFYVPMKEASQLHQFAGGMPPSIRAGLLHDTARIQHVIAAIPDVFLSGAIGFHFLVTTWLIVEFMDDWNKEVKKWPSPGAKAKIGSGGTAREIVTGGTARAVGSPTAGAVPSHRPNK
jgi:hypothetical protein